CVLYLLASGELPFKGGDTMGVLLSLATTTPRPVSELAPTLPPALARLITRLLSKDPKDRPDSAQAVLAELRQIDPRADAGPAAPPTVEQLASPAPRPVPPARTPRAWSRWAVAAAALVLLGLGAGAWLYGGMLVRIVTDKGELVVEVDDPDVQ